MTTAAFIAFGDFYRILVSRGFTEWLDEDTILYRLEGFDIL